MQTDQHANATDHDSIAEKLNDSSIDRVMAIDLSWNIIAWNRTSELISGIKKDSVIGKNLLDVFPQMLNDEELLQAIKSAFEGKKTFLPSDSRSFNRLYSENHFIPLKENNGKLIGVMNIMHDVAHRIKAEKQLQKLNLALEKKYHQLKKANNELATFTYITGRDIKEPLKHVYTSLELLAKKEGQILSNISKGNLRRMQSSLNRMNLLLDDILAVSGISCKDKPLSSVDLTSVLEEVLGNMAGKIFETKAHINAVPLPVIPGYKDMLLYFFHNIIDNALKFQDEENIPELVISGTIVNIAPGPNEFSEDRAYARISFADNGIGFDPRDSEKIFLMFERLHDRKYHGSGTGLTICKKIIEEHDGFIEVDSEPGKGSAFHCNFPLAWEE